MSLICHRIITIYNFWTVYYATQQLILLEYKYLFLSMSQLLSWNLQIYITLIYWFVWYF